MIDDPGTHPEPHDRMSLDRDSGEVDVGQIVDGQDTVPTAPRSVARNAVALLLSQSFTWVLATIVTSIQPRFLGPVGQGQLRLAISVWTIVEMLATFGTSTMLQVEVARHPSTSLSLSRSVVRLRLVCVAIVTPFVAVFLWLAGYGRTTLIVMFLAGVATLFSLAATNYRSVLYGLREMGRTSKNDVFLKLLVTIVTITILVLGGGVTELSVAGIGLMAVSLYLIRRSFVRAMPVQQTDSALRGRALVQASAPFLIADASLIIYLQIDTIVISLLVGSQEIGYYATADTLFGSILFVPVILMTALFPAIAELHTRDPDEVKRMLVRTYRSLLIFAVPAGIGTIVVAKSFVRILYGSKFAKSVPVLEIYGIVTIFEFITILLGRFAQATGRTRFWNILMVISIVISIPLDVVLVPWADRHFQNGAIGGPLAYVVTELFMLITGTIYLADGLWTHATLRRVLRCTVAGAAMFAVGWPLRDHFFLVPGTAALITYIVVMSVGGKLEPDEQYQLDRLRARIMSKRSKRKSVEAT